jgi:hypothetical protein
MNTSNDPATTIEVPDRIVSIDVEISDTQNHLKLGREALTTLVRETLLAESKRLASISLAIVDNRRFKPSIARIWITIGPPMSSVFSFPTTKSFKEN